MGSVPLEPAFGRLSGKVGKPEMVTLVVVWVPRRVLAPATSLTTKYFVPVKPFLELMGMVKVLLDPSPSAQFSVPVLAV